VAYDTGVRQFAAPGLGHVRDIARLLPDDAEWVLTSGVNEKSARRIPSLHNLRAFYVQSLEAAMLVEEALKKVGVAPPSLPPSLSACPAGVWIPRLDLSFFPP
jgi:hypothetical protein